MKGYIQVNLEVTFTIETMTNIPVLINILKKSHKNTDNILQIKINHRKKIYILSRKKNYKQNLNNNQHFNSFSFSLHTYTTY